MLRNLTQTTILAKEISSYSREGPKWSMWTQIKDLDGLRNYKGLITIT